MPRHFMTILAGLWALLVLGSLLLVYVAPSGDTPAERAMSRIETFLSWQGAALVVALVAGILTWRRREPRGTQAWWTGFGPLIGSAVLAGFVLLAVLSAKLF